MRVLAVLIGLFLAYLTFAISMFLINADIKEPILSFPVTTEDFSNSLIGLFAFFGVISLLLITFSMGILNEKLNWILRTHMSVNSSLDKHFKNEEERNKIKVLIEVYKQQIYMLEKEIKDSEINAENMKNALQKEIDDEASSEEKKEKTKSTLNEFMEKTTKDVLDKVMKKSEIEVNLKHFLTEIERKNKQKLDL